MKFTIILLAACFFISMIPNGTHVTVETPRRENVPPKRPKAKAKRDTTPKRADERTAVGASWSSEASAENQEEDLRLINFDVSEGYKFYKTGERLDTIELIADSWKGAFDLNKTVNVRMLFFPDAQGNGKVLDFGQFPIKQFTVKIPVETRWYGHFLLQFTQANTECQAEYSFWLKSPDTFTKVIYFKPSFINCKFPKNGQ
jgi:hypothetical protein